LEGAHRVRVFNVSRIGITLDSRFDLDFNTAFPTGPVRSRTNGSMAATPARHRVASGLQELLARLD
jgi:hypothetical protein